MDPDLRASLLAGAAAGAAGLAAFTLLHVALVAPLWGLLLVGLLPALVGGVWVGWAHHELRERASLPPRPLQGPAFGALLWVALVPLEVVAVARGGAPGVAPMEAMRNLPPEAALPLLAGALAGWALARSWRAALAMALAALALALPVAGTLVALGAQGMGPAVFAGLLPVYALAGLVLAEVRPRVPGAAP